jgi:hypothetical protein
VQDRRVGIRRSRRRSGRRCRARHLGAAPAGLRAPGYPVLPPGDWAIDAPTMTGCGCWPAPRRATQRREMPLEDDRRVLPGSSARFPHRYATSASSISRYRGYPRCRSCRLAPRQREKATDFGDHAGWRRTGSPPSFGRARKASAMAICSRCFGGFAASQPSASSATRSHRRPPVPPATRHADGP